MTAAPVAGPTGVIPADSAAGGRDSAPTLRRIAVVVPVHNEEQLLGKCLRRLRRAMDVLRAARPECGVKLVVVLDRCTDQSAKIARHAARADGRIAVLAGDFGSVGAARAAGVCAALEADGRNAAAEETWLACTDADTLVPEDWLTSFALLANAGADAVAGTVEPETSSLAPGLLRAWRDNYAGQEPSTRVHGANLGVRASMYLAAGGFPALAEHEDVRLVEAIRTLGGLVLPAAHLQVTTSGRLQGRTPGGFAGYLANLEAAGS
ncbi:glycosyltransferase [Arthrobacter sulfonylureivorans]|uniref:4,4'-diaponeurosporenoate glycosyltransferase n=1 Tax=Arthrobacter sulfonylureivorans TaxID=2486855 RepID=A0ABY3W802_9MICC|nr:glycosyltransferase [Arthrobacter sulfonylureivorans]UNK45243.1 glycosyltransferase [Arthrobacter sulfonylureivorans]